MRETYDLLEGAVREVDRYADRIVCAEDGRVDRSQ